MADAAGGAVNRMRAARERARQRREASKKAVELLRARNREESRQLVERAKLAKRPHQDPWPGHRPPRPRELSLYNVDDAEQRPQFIPRPPAPQRTTDDDWSQESWLH